MRSPCSNVLSSALASRVSRGWSGMFRLRDTVKPHESICDLSLQLAPGRGALLWGSLSSRLCVQDATYRVRGQSVSVSRN